MQPFPAAFFARVSDKMVTVTPIHLFCALCVALLIVISFFYNKLGFDGFLYPAFSGSCAGSIFLYGPNEIHVGKNSWHGCKGVLKLVELVHAHGRQTGVGQRGAEQKTEFAQLYFPCLSAEAALKKLRKWIAVNPELHRQLYGGREGKNDQTFSKRQVQLLIDFLEAP